MINLVPSRRARANAKTGRPQSDLGGSDAARAARLLARFTEGRHRTFVLALGWLIIEAVTAVFEAYPLAYLIDYLKGDKEALVLPGLESGRASTVAVLTIAVVLIAIFNSGAASLAQIYLARGGRALGFQLRVSLFGHLQRLSLAFHDRRHTGDAITRVTGDVKEVEKFVSDSLSDLAGSVLLLIATFAFLGWYSWQVMLVAMLIVPVLAVITSYFSRRIKAAARRQRAREGDLASATQEMLTSIRVVQLFGRARHDQQRFSVDSGKAMDAALEGARLDAWFSLIVSVLEGLSIAAVIWIGLWLVDSGLLTVGTLVLFAILVQRMFKPTRKIVKQWNKIARVYASVERIADLLAQEVTVRDEPGAVPAPALRGHVEFKDVEFAYDAGPDGGRAAQGPRREPALRGVSFAISPGEVVALVGHSGVGKTTIAQLVPRLYDPQKGQVLLDGHDVRSFTLESLRSQISMVLQETVLLRATVAENIAYGRTDATREQIMAAAVRANAHEFIVQMPDGYDTQLSERAANLSGGQRQRIAIARAFIRDTPLLILDEPTTGLDAESTELVLSALRSLITEKTTLIISHDLNLIRRADRILVMRTGDIVESGTHEALLVQNGLYAQLHASQFSDHERRPARGRSGDRTHSVQRNGSGHLSEALFDPLRSDELRRKLPHLDLALDGDAMRERLQDALIGPPSAGWAIERCTAGKALYLPGEGCKLRYELEVRRNGETRRAIVGARLFREARTRDAHLREQLEPLAGLTRSRDEMRPFTAPVAALDSLPMAVYAFPIDPELPTLIRASDPTEMLELFHDSLPDVLGEPLMLDACRVQPAKYARRRRCVLRYDLEGRLGTSQEPAHRTLYGKVDAAHAGRTEPLLASMRERARDGAAEYRFRVPRLVIARPELNLNVLEGVPGAPQIGALIKSRVRDGSNGSGNGPNGAAFGNGSNGAAFGNGSNGAAFGNGSNRAAFGNGSNRSREIALEDAIDACAHIAAALHAGDETAPRRRLKDDVSALRPDLSMVARMSPELGVRLEQWMGQISNTAATLAPMPMRLSHGDYTPSQVLFGSDVCGLLDFDGVCRAEPALDLGQFCAYLRVACAKSERRVPADGSGLGDALSDRFLRTYVEAAAVSRSDAQRLPRVAVYEALSLVRMSLRSWQQLKPARLAAVLRVLEERMACLPRLTR